MLVVILDVVVAGALRTIDAYTSIWLVGLILFGVHLVLIGSLALRSGFVAKVFGVLLVVAGLGYAIDGFVVVLVAGPSFSVGQLTFVGEVALIGWLLAVGRRTSYAPGEPEQHPTTEQAGTPAPGVLIPLARTTP